MSGVLRLRKELDFEKQQFFNLTLTAEDRGVPSLISQTFVEVEVCIVDHNLIQQQQQTSKTIDHFLLLSPQVVDVNENLYAPYFPDFAVRGSVKENSRAGTSVLTVSAKDDDKGRDGVLRYSVRGGSGLGTFTIDEDTGVTEDQSETLIMQSGNPITLHAPRMGMSLLKMCHCHC